MFSLQSLEKSLSVLAVLFLPFGLQAQSWYFTENYPWIWNSEQGWMYADAEYAKFYQYPGWQPFYLGEDTSRSLELVDGMFWTLSWEFDGEPRNTTVEYTSFYEPYDQPALVIENPLLDTVDNSGLLILGNLQDFEFEDGSLVLVGGVLSNFASTLTFTLTGDNTGTFEVKDLSVGVTRTGTFTVTVLPESDRFDGF